MIVVRRGKEPDSLLQFRKQYPDADYERDMPSNVLKDVREQMWEEQKHLCAYCMKKIDNPGVVRIEHCRPRNPQNEADYDKKAALDFKWMLAVYAEYFAVPLLCGREERRGVCLPILTALVQTAATLGMALVFGRTYPARELLRAWSTGTFSRLDAALLLVWLTCAIFRIGVLCTAIRMLGQEYAIQKRKEVRQ